MNCKACGIELVKVDIDSKTDYHFDNALWIGFFGGYSMFVDDVETDFDFTKPIIKDSAEEAVICHDCAHELCEKLPWINQLLKPERSHSHTADFWKDNPDHVGWDSPKSRLK